MDLPDHVLWYAGALVAVSLLGAAVAVVRSLFPADVGAEDLPEDSDDPRT